MEETELGPFPWWTNASSLVASAMVLPTLVACYIGLSSQQRTIEQYLHGGKQMTTLPIAISLVGSAVSGITILAIPVDVYLHGTQVLGTLISLYIAIAIVILFVLPRLYNQQYNSLFEFLEQHYSKKTRTVITAIFILKTMLYLPFVIYASTVGFSKVTAVPTHLMIFILSVTCIFYTAVGGFKGIVWSQFLQMLLMTTSLLAVVFIGCHGFGGFDKVLEVSDSGGRLELLNFSPDPISQNAFWTTIIGMSISWLYFIGTNPGSYQKLISIPREENAIKALLWFGVGVTFVKLLIVFLGLTMYAEFSDCDPLSTAEVGKGLLMLYYITEKSAEYPGLEALFSAGLLSAAFSFVSSNLNTVSGIIYEDFVRRYWPRKLKGKHAATHIKRITVLIGALVTLLAFQCGKLNPALIQLFLTVHKFTDGAIVAVFFIGLFRSRISSKAVIIGTLVSICGTCWIVYSAHWYVLSGDAIISQKPMSTVGCPEYATKNPDFQLNGTHYASKLHLLGESIEGVLTAAHVPKLRQMSFYHYTTLGIVITLIVSTLYGEFVYGVSQGQNVGNIIEVVLPASQLKHKHVTEIKAKAWEAEKLIPPKKLEMTSVREEKELPKVHDKR